MTTTMPETVTKRSFGLSFIAYFSLTKGIIASLMILTGRVQLSNLDTIDLLFEHLEWISYLLIGIGLLKSQKWAWWLVTVMIGFTIMYGVYDMIKLQIFFADIGMDQGPNIFNSILKNITILFIQAIMLIYLFTRDVFIYFSLDYKTLSKKIVIVLAISIALTLVGHWLNGDVVIQRNLAYG